MIVGTHNITSLEIIIIIKKKTTFLIENISNYLYIYNTKDNSSQEINVIRKAFDNILNIVIHISMFLSQRISWNTD